MTQTPASSNSCTATFNDRHIHGVAGVDFATSSPDDIRQALALLARRRTTRVTASVPTLELSQLGAALDGLERLYFDGLLDGVHLEGPFLARDYAGAHPPHGLLVPASDPGQTYVETLLDHQSASGLITMLTLAPELDGFEDLVTQLVSHQIQPALGHTAATYQEMHAAIHLVSDLTGQPVVITHLYNAMRRFHHRDPGPVLAVVEAAHNDQVAVELIADGSHVDLALIRWWLQHFPHAVRLVSDASAATQIPGISPVSSAPPRLGHQVLSSGADGPVLANGHTRASGGKDLLAMHDDLVSAGFDHERVCAALH